MTDVITIAGTLYEVSVFSPLDGPTTVDCWDLSPTPDGGQVLTIHRDPAGALQVTTNRQTLAAELLSFLISYADENLAEVAE